VSLSTPNMPAPANPELMQCLEVRGGNCRANELFEMAGLRAWVFSRPHGDAEGGGDVYYISSCASGRITRMLLADVSGHGAEVAGVAEELRELMRKNINYIKQTRLVREMNLQFPKTGHERGYATALVWTFFQPTQSLQLSNAGHPSPLIYRLGSNGWSVQEHHPARTSGIENVPLGIFSQADYSETETSLNPGDLLLCFSDAVTESLDASGEQLGSQGILEIVSALDASKPEQFVPTLLHCIDSKNPENPHLDDMSIILVQATGSGTPLINNLLAPFRLARGVRDRTHLKANG
jgi:phosphoserine phosphatase RsbU/P